MFICVEPNINVDLKYIYNQFTREYPNTIEICILYTLKICKKCATLLMDVPRTVMVRISHKVFVVGIHRV